MTDTLYRIAQAAWTVAKALFYAMTVLCLRGCW